jgi:hypothetical protein
VTVLLLNDRGWGIATSSWTAGATGENAVTLIYEWGPDGASFFAGATGTCRVTVELTMLQFVERLKKSDGGIVDLREWTR